MAGKPSKGGEFERVFSRWLSVWWTMGGRDDVFWRSAGSGALATVRGQQAQSGDIIAVEQEGIRLIRAVTFELKCGYPEVRWGDVMDGLGCNHKSPFLAWVAQAVAAQQTADTPAWSLVVKQARKHPMIWFPHWVADLVNEARYRPFDHVEVRLVEDDRELSLMGYRLEDWFAMVRPLPFVEALESDLEKISEIL